MHSSKLLALVDISPSSRSRRFPVNYSELPRSLWFKGSHREGPSIPFDSIFKNKSNTLNIFESYISTVNPLCRKSSLPSRIGLTTSGQQCRPSSAALCQSTGQDRTNFASHFNKIIFTIVNILNLKLSETCFLSVRNWKEIHV